MSRSGPALACTIGMAPLNRYSTTAIPKCSFHIVLRPKSAFDRYSSKTSLGAFTSKTTYCSISSFLTNSFNSTTVSSSCAVLVDPTSTSLYGFSEVSRYLAYSSIKSPCLFSGLNWARYSMVRSFLPNGLAILVSSIPVEGYRILGGCVSTTLDQTDLMWLHVHVELHRVMSMHWATNS
ncbi:hypothetical protein OGAPHI_001422 [Ogataea philodendri]|uniref:Uncharacterized protein n=1 Tax=Ogataea philodendri TaxID=1378263 RepID=A0A9P8T7Y0_9ASCO|nr:uncharacterized protein OGAPHI_001422 [Ogataea philodendri]KAH3669301.1 hypothetical protein OGAPHI_001422 [Ogataea philodendri]